MTPEEIEEKHNRYTKGEGTADDIAFFESFYVKFNAQTYVTTEDDNCQDVADAWQQIEAGIGVPKRNLWQPWMAAAAVLLMMLSISVYLFIYRTNPKSVSYYANDVAPGSSKAVLTLSNGQKIALDDRHNGLVAKDANATIRKTNTGAIAYTPVAETAATAFNTMTTPTGGKYELKLADGTIAILDAESSITYPVAFTGKERQVKITGQVYFEVAHNAQHPFLVKFNNNVVKVLGTHFNINAYADEPDSRTTLLQGSIALKTGTTETLLKPGEQGVLHQNDGDIKIVAANVRIALSWKDDYFHFEKQNIRDIMRQLSRWYGIEVVYEGEVTGEEFSGDISRNKNISQILHMLEYSQSVHFKISGRRVVVMP